VLPVTQGEWAKKAYKLRTHSGKVLDIFEGNLQNGNKIIQWDDHGSLNQQWIIVPFDQAVPKYEKSSNKSPSILGINLPNINLPGISNLNNIGFPKFG
jgi:Ricin-type beta-trefoil lectin domain-like